LRHLILETDTIDEHAINFSALTGFLIYLGRIPHKLQSLELLGGWRLLNMEDADIENLKASTVLDGLRTLVWESCAKWCHDCVLARATRTEMSIFADLASCCPNIVMLGLPGFFVIPCFPSPRWPRIKRQLFSKVYLVYLIFDTCTYSKPIDSNLSGLQSHCLQS
jgi:hypothetical protein